MANILAVLLYQLFTWLNTDIFLQQDRTLVLKECQCLCCGENQFARLSH